jgi:hypothetical protein
MEAAVDPGDLPGEVAPLRVGHDLHHLGLLVRLAPAPHRDLADDPLQGFLGMAATIHPGATELTVIPLRAVSRARLLVNPNSPDLAAA